MYFSDLTLISIWILILLLLATYAVAACWLLKKKKKNRKPAETAADLTPVIEELLAQRHCQFSKKTEEDETTYDFNYQNGLFTIICKNNGTTASILFPNFLTSSTDTIELARYVCNTCNMQGWSHRATYTIYGDENRVGLSLITPLEITSPTFDYASLFYEKIEQCFSIARFAYQLFDKAKQSNGNRPFGDQEKEDAEKERDTFLLKEQEIMTQPDKLVFRSSVDKPLTLCTIFRQLYDLEHPEFIELKIVTHELKTLITETEIANYDISTTLVSPDAEGKPNFSARNATLILHYTPDKNSQADFPRELTISLQSENGTSGQLYMSATLSQKPEGPYANHAQLRTTGTTEYLHFIFAFDRTDPSEKMEQMSFNMSEIMEKMVADRPEPLTPEEEIIYHFRFPNFWENIYRGKNLYRQKRYYEALNELLPVYQYLNRQFQHLNKKQRQYFFDLCYSIGICYSELGLYEKAYIHLDRIFPLKQADYMKAYVNCLVNANDFRAYGIVENMISHTQQQIADAEEGTEENLTDFLNFLLRRKVSVLITLGSYDNAHKLLQAMLQEEINQDFAINELARLQKIIEENESHTDNKPDDETPETPEAPLPPEN